MKKQFLLLLLISFPFVSYSCSCFSTPMSSVKITKYDLVIKGKVIDKQIVSNPDQQDGFSIGRDLIEYTIEIKDQIKPVRHNRIVKIYSNRQGSSCGVNFEIKSEYYIFSYRNKNRYHTGLCAGNRRANKVNKQYKKFFELYKKGGEQKIWYDADNAKLAKGSIYCSAPTGDWIYYHKDGSVACTGYYEKGKKQGEWKQYLDIKTSREFYEGLGINGRSMVSDKENIFKEIIIYDKGNIVSREHIPYLDK